MERKLSCISDAGNWVGGGGQHLSKDQLLSRPCPWQAVGESIYRELGVGGLHAETAQSSLTVIFKLVISALTSIILVVLSTVALQLWGALVPISLQLSLRIVVAQVLSTVWSSGSELFHLEFWYLQDNSQAMAQSIIYSPWGSTKGP